MDLAACMDQIGDQLDTIDRLKVYRYPPDSIQPHAAVVDLPESYTLDATFGRGADQMTIPVTVLVGKVSDRASRDQIAPYFRGSGPRSIKAVVEAGTYTAFDAESLQVRVADEPFEVWTYAGVAYLGGAFRVDVTGEGA
jgi:hypothetical protein